MDINFVCSFGKNCHSSNILKTYNLKTCSYPFDWIFINPKQIEDSLNSNFDDLLDADLLVPQGHRCKHKKYLPRYGSGCIFQHHNPTTEPDRGSFQRRMERLRSLLAEEKEKKLIFFHTSTHPLDKFDEVLSLSEKLKEKARILSKNK